MQIKTADSDQLREPSVKSAAFRFASVSEAHRCYNLFAEHLLRDSGHGWNFVEGRRGQEGKSWDRAVIRV